MKKAALQTVTNIEPLVRGIKAIIEKAREKTANIVNREMLLTYWEIGKLIAPKESNIIPTENLYCTCPNV